MENGIYIAKIGETSAQDTFAYFYICTHSSGLYPSFTAQFLNVVVNNAHTQSPVFGNIAELCITANFKVDKFSFEY